MRYIFSFISMIFFVCASVYELSRDRAREKEQEKMRKHHRSIADRTTKEFFELKQYVYKLEGEIGKLRPMQIGSACKCPRCGKDFSDFPVVKQHSWSGPTFCMCGQSLDVSDLNNEICECGDPKDRDETYCWICTGVREDIEMETKEKEDGTNK